MSRLNEDRKEITKWQINIEHCENANYIKNW